MSTRIYLIRHAESTANAEDRFAGAIDPPLSDEGRTHAEGLATRLASFKIEAVYASPMQRTMQTAQSIAALQFVEVAPLDALREVNHGHWEGMTRAEVEQKYPEEYAAYERDPYNFQAVGGTSAKSVLERAAPALLEIVRQHPNAEVAVVSHKATNRLLIGYFLGIDLRGYRDKLAQRPACLNVLDFDGENKLKLALLNDVSHYQICAPPEDKFVV
jgi:broad specificity phosphatase PhoE